MIAGAVQGDEQAQILAVARSRELEQERYEQRQKLDEARRLQAAAFTVGSCGASPAEPTSAADHRRRAPESQLRFETRQIPPPTPVNARRWRNAGRQDSHWGPDSPSQARLTRADVCATETDAPLDFSVSFGLRYVRRTCHDTGSGGKVWSISRSDSFETCRSARIYRRATASIAALGRETFHYLVLQLKKTSEPVSSVRDLFCEEFIMAQKSGCFARSMRICVILQMFM
jgi:hypothetical protein